MNATVSITLNGTIESTTSVDFTTPNSRLTTETTPSSRLTTETTSSNASLISTILPSSIPTVLPSTDKSVTEVDTTTSPSGTTSADSLTEATTTEMSNGTDASLIAGIGDDLLFSVIGFGVALILLSLALLICFCLLKRKVNKLSKELRLMRDEDGTTTASDRLQLRLTTLSNGKPGNSTISSSIGDKHMGRERGGEGGDDDRDEGMRIGSSSNNSAPGNFYTDNYVVSDSTAGGRYVYSQEVRDTPEPRRNQYEKEEAEQRKLKSSALPPEKERYRPDPHGRPPSGVIYERPSIYQKTPLIQALRPDNDFHRSAPPEVDVKSPANEAKYLNYRPANDYRYERSPASSRRESRDVKSASDVRSSYDSRAANNARSPHDGRPANESRRSSEGRPANEGRLANEGRPANEGRSNDSNRAATSDDRERYPKPSSKDQRNYEATIGEDIDSWRKLYRQDDSLDELIPTNTQSNDVPSRKSIAQNNGAAEPGTHNTFLEEYYRGSLYDNRHINLGGPQYYPHASGEYGNHREERF